MTGGEPDEFFSRRDLVAVEGGPLVTHGEAVCAGEVCCVHNPSDHHMLTWPQDWNGEFRRMDRRCPHGLPHPDPDGMTFLRSLYPTGAYLRAIHTCDGCCIGGRA